VFTAEGKTIVVRLLPLEAGGEATKERATVLSRFSKKEAN
jgi:hypothetical protein